MNGRPPFGEQQVNEPAEFKPHARVQTMKFRRTDSPEKGQRELPDLLIRTLTNLENEAFILAPGEVTIFATPGTEQVGILKDGKIQSPELIATVRVVRRTNKKQVGKIDIPRGPIGEGIHELTVTVIPISEEDLVLVLVSDESEAERVHEVRRDFVANISHELKTPIGALSLLSEAVLGAKDDPVAVFKFASRMQSESKRLTDLVQEIIDELKIENVEIEQKKLIVFKHKEKIPLKQFFALYAINKISTIANGS